ncbi:MHS family MFS transporter [Pseudonocardia sp. MCCB 268]|nr:MHS family MFS transporter [Pseudonocardia cytotoxica]
MSAPASRPLMIVAAIPRMAQQFPTDVRSSGLGAGREISGAAAGGFRLAGRADHGHRVARERDLGRVPVARELRCSSSSGCSSTRSHASSKRTRAAADPDVNVEPQASPIA